MSSTHVCLPSAVLALDVVMSGGCIITSTCLQLKCNTHSHTFPRREIFVSLPTQNFPSLGGKVFHFVGFYLRPSHTYTHTHVHSHIHTHTHMHIHTHTHTGSSILAASHSTWIRFSKTPPPTGFVCVYVHVM